MRRRSLEACGVWLIAGMLSAAARGATLHTDDFQSSLAGWTSGGAITVRAESGGPAGEGDAFVQVTPTFRNLAVYNSTPAWTGDFSAIGATALTADLMAPVGSEALAVRLVLFGPGQTPNNFVPRWTSTVAVDVPADGAWRNHSFSLAEEDLTLVLNSGTHDALMGGVLRVMLRHDPGAPNSTGTPVDGTLGVDNVTLAGDATLGGDYNDDGVVDAADYAAWRDNLGGPAGALPNDVDGGPIGVAQYETWRAAYASATQFATPAPEPGVLALLLTGVALPTRRFARFISESNTSRAASW